LTIPPPVGVGGIRTNIIVRVGRNIITDHLVVTMMMTIIIIQIATRKDHPPSDVDHYQDVILLPKRNVGENVIAIVIRKTTTTTTRLPLVLPTTTYNRKRPSLFNPVVVVVMISCSSARVQR
jgi:hypothetical protein